MSEPEKWVLKTLSRASWDLASAVVFARELQPIAHLAGHNLMLGGGVLNVGYSDSDLDLVLIPRAITNTAVVINKLIDLGWDKIDRSFIDIIPVRFVYRFVEQSTQRGLDLIVLTGDN